jgi:hypothetical protein
MPAILLEEHHDGWTGKAGKKILVPYPADRMKAWPIGSRVNSPKNNDAELVTPIETSDDNQQGANSWRMHSFCRLFASIPGGFDGGVVCFRVYLEQLALALKVTKPAL